MERERRRQEENKNSNLKMIYKLHGFSSFPIRKQERRNRKRLCVLAQAGSVPQKDTPKQCAAALSRVS